MTALSRRPLPRGKRDSRPSTSGVTEDDLWAVKPSRVKPAWQDLAITVAAGQTYFRWNVSKPTDHGTFFDHRGLLRGRGNYPPGRRRDLPVLFPSYGERDESYRCGKGMGDGKDSRSRCPDELFVSARVVC